MNSIRATIYIKPELHKALKYKSAETSQSISNIVNEALAIALTEDAIDLTAFDERKNERSSSFEDVLKELKNDGLI